MSLPSKKQSPYEQQDKADLLSLLQVIENLYESYKTVLNNYTQNTLLLSLTLEAQMLLNKLRVMNKRWHCHLPFKEACTVRFFDWSKKIEKMSQSLEADESGNTGNPVSEYCPSKHFVLDLYESLSEKTSDADHELYYQETNIKTFLNIQNKIRKQITGNWSFYRAQFSHATAMEVDQLIGNVVVPLDQKSNIIRQTCSEVLKKLSVELNQLDNILTGVFSRDQLIRLAERVINESDYNCNKAEQAAKRYIAEIKNTNPEEEWAELFDLEIQMALETIIKLKYGKTVTRFIGDSNTLEGHYLGFGRFLHSSRHEITEKDLYDLMEQLYRLHYLREEIEQQKATQRNTVQEDEKVMAEDLSPESSPSRKTASEILKTRQETKPNSPKLPSFFSKKLSTNVQATEAFYHVLHHIGFYIGRPLLPQELRDSETKYYKGWKWKHLRDALSELDIIATATTQNGLAEYLQSVFPYLRADNIKRGFNSRGTYEDPSIHKRIVSDIKNEFQSVVDGIK